MTIDITKNQIYHGDSLDLIKDIPDNTIDLLLTDPPYNITQKNNFKTMGRRGIEWEWDGGFDQKKWLELIEPKLKKGANIVIFNDWKNLGNIAEHMTTLGIIPKKDICYSKKNPMPRNVDRSFVSAREYAIWGVKPGKWTFNKRKGVPYETGLFNYPVQHDDHPAKKPDGLFNELISLLSNKGDFVVDPFSGSGTTAFACERLGRLGACFEIDATFYNNSVAELNTIRSFINGTSSSSAG